LESSTLVIVVDVTRTQSSQTRQRVRDRIFRLNPFRLFALAGLVGTLAIGGASLVASQRAGESEAIADVRVLTELVAKTVVEPNLSSALVSGSPAAIERLDRIVASRVIDARTVRVKLWDASGRIVYSDEPRLIGEMYELDEEKNESLWSGNIVSEISSLEGTENRFEVQAGQLLEVYLPIDGPDGAPLLYESYFAMSEVTDSATRIRLEFVPIVVAALLLMAIMHLGLAWGLSRRIRRGQQERELLLQRAIDSSDIERRRIAAAIHDGVVQDLIGTSLALTAAAETAESNGPGFANDLRAAAVGTRRSLQSLRSLLVDVYPPNLHKQGLEAALVDLLSPANSLGIETELTVSGDPDAAPDAIRLVYRVVQESVRNVLRHANALVLRVGVDASQDRIVVTVEDDGKGFRTNEGAPSGHFGLRLMADLTADAGAGFSISSTPGAGTAIRLEVPR